MKNSTDIRQNLHLLIDKIDNNELLEIAYELLSSKSAYQEGELIKNLTAEEKKELYESYDESFDDSNLIDLEDMKKKQSKWREK